MKKKINLNLALVSLLTIFATVVVSISMFYQLFKSEIGDNLRDIAYAISDKDVINEMKSGQYKPLMDDIRITLIDSNGKVLYDSEVDPAVLDNHLARPEVESAIKNGSGKSVRRSDTIMKMFSTMQCALILQMFYVYHVRVEACGICLER